MNRFCTCMLFVAGLIAIVWLSAPAIGVAALPKRVLILPLTIHSQKDLAYLQDGIIDMLSFRLAQSGEVQPIEKSKVKTALSLQPGPIDAEKAISLAAHLGADYVIFGSLTLFDEVISTDARLIDVKSHKALEAISQLGESQGDVIRHMDQFAGKINRSIFGRQNEVPEAVVAPAPVEAPRTHGRKSIETGQTRPGSMQPAPPTSAPVQPTERWISRKLKTSIRGLAVGDVDGDGRLEAAFINRHIVYVYRREEQGLVKIAQYEEKSYNQFLSIDIADINQNGKAEIFVSNLISNSNRLASFVLEWDAGRLRQLGDSQNIYFRTIRQPSGDILLLGQKRGRSTDSLELKNQFEGDVFEVGWQSGTYEPVRRKRLPRGTNVFNFTYGDVLNTGEEQVIAYSKANKLKIYATTNEIHWSGEEGYGSSNVYLEYSARDSSEDVKRYYLPTRIIVTDLEGDGLQEVLAVKNHESMKVFSHLKLFKGGRIDVLTWTGLNLAPKFSTESALKFISDFDVGDLDNDGRREIVFAVVEKTGGGFSKGQSFIVMQKIQ
jgi:TolB-like protein